MGAHPRRRPRPPAASAPHPLLARLRGAAALPWGRWLLAGCLLALTLWLQWRLWAGPDGVPRVLRLEEAIQAQRERNAELAERNQALAAEVRDLKHGLAAVEERARQELGMIGRDETFFRIVPREAGR
ncbi:MAG: cell division protein FtsB [Gammaproteobacteria bacterium]|nr:MAG: cell division protein FtsB [Gammaproteobacteria bacterium]